MQHIFENTFNVYPTAKIFSYIYYEQNVHTFILIKFNHYFEKQNKYYRNKINFVSTSFNFSIYLITIQSLESSIREIYFLKYSRDVSSCKKRHSFMRHDMTRKIKSNSELQIDET